MDVLLEGGGEFGGGDEIGGEHVGRSRGHGARVGEDADMFVL